MIMKAIMFTSGILLGITSYGFFLEGSPVMSAVFTACSLLLIWFSAMLEK